MTLEEAETQLHGKCIQGVGRGQQMLPSCGSLRGLVELELQLPTYEHCVTPGNVRRLRDTPCNSGGMWPYRQLYGL